MTSHGYQVALLARTVSHGGTMITNLIRSASGVKTKYHERKGEAIGPTSQSQRLTQSLRLAFRPRWTVKSLAKELRKKLLRRTKSKPGEVVTLNRAKAPVPPPPQHPVQDVGLTKHNAIAGCGVTKATTQKTRMTGPTSTLDGRFASFGPTVREPSGSPCGSYTSGGGTPLST